MQSEKSLLIVNPISGTRKKGDISGRLKSALEPKGISLECMETTGGGDAERFARKAAAEGFRSVVVAGGDGTVREAATALCGTETALGIIPSGSGNGLARTIQIPQDFDKAIEIIAAGHTDLCDYGTAGNIPFFCTFGLGFDAAVTDKFATSGRRGKMSYVKSALQKYLTYEPEAYGLEINGRVITRKALLIAVCNATQYGNNAYIAPQASIKDGLLDVVIMHRGSPLTDALGAFDLMTGNLDKNTLVETFRVPKLSISRLHDGQAQCDGDLVDLGRVIHIQCHPAKLKLITPEVQSGFIPVISPLKGMIEDVHYDFQHFIHTLREQLQ